MRSPTGEAMAGFSPCKAIGGVKRPVAYSAQAGGQAQVDTVLMPSRDQLAELCRRWKVVELAVFGSAARGDAGPQSDVDLLVTFEADADWSALDIVDMRSELAALFGRTVDLVEERALRNPYRKQSILRDKSVVYAA